MNELKKKAAELEYAQRLSEALEHIVRLARESEDAQAAAYWRRAGSLQNRLGQTAEAAGSYARALEGFVAAGLRNDAIATGLNMLANGNADPDAVLQLLELTLESRYAHFARTAAAELFRSAVASGDTRTLEAIAGYLQGAPAASAAAAVDEMLKVVSTDDLAAAVPALKAIWSRLTEAGADASADAVRIAIGRIDPSQEPQASAQPRADTTGDAASATDDALPLIDASGLPVDDEPASIPLLEGFESTHAVDDDAPGIVSDESLVVEHTSLADGPSTDAPIEPAGQAQVGMQDLAPPEEAPEDEVVDDEEEYVEPLPLLEPAPRPSRAGGDSGPSADVEGDGNLDLDSERLEEPGPGQETADLDVEAILRDLSPIAAGDVEPGDAASHYDVAVAFKEMGMTRDALARLRAALEGGHNPLATLEVVGEILVTQGDIKSAARILSHARSAGDAPDEERAGVLYWLARSEEALGRAEEAGRLLNRVVRAVPDYRDAAERLGRLPEPRL